MINPHHDLTSPLPSELADAAPPTALLPAELSEEPHVPPAAETRTSSRPAVGPGTVLRGRYVLQERLGTGGMGTVYRALDLNKHDLPLDHQYVAVKVLREGFAHRPDALQALRREAHQAQSLSHPGIVNVFDFDRDGDVYFITMELLDGELLSDLIRRTQPGRLPRATAIRILRELGQAVAYAHERGVLHVDLKPGNVMITTRGEVRVLDFGLAHPHMREPWIAEQAHSFPAATAAYASCERLEGAAPDARDDVFSFACVAYELLGGEHPFGRRPAVEAREKGRRPRRIRGLSGLQWRTLRRALAWNRYDRLRSIDDLIEGLGLAAIPRSRPARHGIAEPPSRRGISQWWLVPVVFVLLAAGLYLAWAEWGRDGGRDRVAGVPSAGIERSPPGEAPLPASPVEPDRVATDAVVVESIVNGEPLARLDVVPALELTPAPATAPIIAAAGPGRVELAGDTMTVSESDSVARIRVVRRGGAGGPISFVWRTADDSAQDGRDYAAQGPVRETMAPGQTSTTLLVPIVSDGVPERTELFDVFIGDPTGGATLGAITQLTVILVDDD